MAYSVETIKTDVRTILDRNEVTSSLSGLSTDVDTLSLDDIITKEIIPAARQVEMIAPKEFVDWTDIDSSECTLSAADNLYTITLPADKFLRFGRVKLSNWKYGLAEFVTTDSKEYKRQWYGVSGLQANSMNPLCALVESNGENPDTTLLLQCFGASTGTTLDYCMVAEEPTITSDALNIGDILKAPFLYVLAALVAQDLKDDTTANNMMKTAKNMLSVNTGSAAASDAATQIAQQQ